MSQPNWLLSRRTILRGAGAALALPLLDAMTGPAARAANAAASPPLRMGIVTVTGGTVLESWKQKQAGPLGKLPSILRSLEPLKDELLILNGLANLGSTENLNGHESCAYLHLTAAKAAKKVDGKSVSSISVDQAAAAALGENTFLPSLELGLSSHETKYSFRTPDAAVPYEANPRLVFERMFRGRAPLVPNWKQRGTANAAVQKSARSDSYERSVLDLVLEDAGSLRGKLGQNDQHKLDEYLHSVRTVEKRIAFVENQQHTDAIDAAATAKLRLPKDLPAAELPIWKITDPVHRDPEKHQMYVRLMAELMVLALQTDTTRVATFAIGSDEAWFPGVITVGYERHAHTLQHQGNAASVDQADPIAREACRQIHTFYTEMFAEMCLRMKQIDEGGSSLLDNTMLLYTSYMADGGHGRENYPALLVGRAGGTLRPGRQIDFKDKTPMANLYIEMLNRMGVPTTEFGDSHTAESRHYDGRLPDLV